MGEKGGQSDSSGMMEAMASAQEAQQAYQLGEQQLQWSEQVWNQEQPLVDQSEQTQISLAQQEEAALQQSMQESGQQWQEYETYYEPEELKYLGQANNWASPEAMAAARGEAMSSVAEQGTAGLNTAAETLRSYGVNPSAPRYASLYTSAQPMLGAAEAAAGTTASQNLRLQQMGLEAGAINTGRGLVNATGSLTQVGTGAANSGANAASGAAGTAQSNLSTGSQANTNSTQFINAGNNAMNTYVNAVNGYNTSQAAFAQANATEMAGLGSAVGGIAGLAYLKSDSRDKTDIKHEGDSESGVPIYSYRYKEDPKSYPKVVGPMAEDVARLAPSAVGALPGPGKLAINVGELRRVLGYDDGGAVDATPPALPPPPTNATLPGGGHIVITPEMRGTPASTPGPTVTYPTGQSQQIMVGPSRFAPPTPAVRQANDMGPIYTRGTGRAVFNDPRAAPAADPRTFPAWKQGYDDAGPVSDPQLTPDQGGGQTGIPSQPVPPAQDPAGLPSDATPGGGVPAYASPSNGQQTDDVPALLTANEFVIPKDVATWVGHKALAQQIDKARQEQQKFAGRDDIGGEPAPAIPQKPTFVSRPPHMGTTQGAIPGMA